MTARYSDARMPGASDTTSGVSTGLNTAMASDSVALASASSNIITFKSWQICRVDGNGIFRPKRMFEGMNYLQ